MTASHFLTLADMPPAEFLRLLSAALKIKSTRRALGHSDRRPLRDRTVALLFEKPSLRTRVTFEVAVSELGGRSIYLGPQEVGLGKRESIPDISRNMSRWVHAIVARTFKHSTVCDLAAHSLVPVINALTDLEHPCQAVGDFMTILDRKRRLKGSVLAFVGDGNNVCHALLYASAKTGVDMRVASPDGFGPSADVLARARKESAKTGGSISIVSDPASAVRGADAVYTDVWVSMGFEQEEEKRRRIFSNYRVDGALMSNAKSDAIFLHCLPARRGDEVTDAVMDGGQSAVLDQAENRLHSAKSILLYLMAPKEFEILAGKKTKAKRRK